MSVLNDAEMGLQHLKNNLESYCAACLKILSKEGGARHGRVLSESLGNTPMWRASRPGGGANWAGCSRTLMISCAIWGVRTTAGPVAGLC